MHDRPTASELLVSVADLLTDEVLPAVSGPLQHQVRVAANLCRIVEREVRLDGGDHPSPSELAEAIRTSDDPDFLAQAHQRVLDMVRAKLAVAKPGYDRFDFSAERAGSPRGSAG